MAKTKAPTLKAAINEIAKVSNEDFWNLARKYSPSFKSHTAEATAEMFTERGFEALKNTDINTLNDFINISMRVGFQMLTQSRAKNPLADSGLVQVYDTPNGGFVQRMAVNTIKPVSPAYKGINNFDSIDPFVVRKPETKERFFAQNFDYQSLVTVQEFQIKTIFINENGMGSWLAGVMQALENGYIIQDYENTLECLNTMIHSDKYPLKDTQNISVGAWNGTADDLKKFIKIVKNVSGKIESVAQTSAFNAAGFASTVDNNDMIVLMRPNLKTDITVDLEVGAFNPDRLTLPYEIVSVDNFGGLVPYTDEHDTIYPVYDKLGTVNGWATTPGAEEADIDEADIKYRDPNEKVLAVIVQKGAIFENAQNPYTVTPIYNPRGMYQNYWANRPNTGINGDYYYNLIIITHD